MAHNIKKKIIKTKPFTICVLYVCVRVCVLHKHHNIFTAKGRTNIELREQFILADGVSQSMSPFKPKPAADRKASISPLSGSTGPITKVTILSFNLLISFYTSMKFVFKSTQHCKFRLNCFQFTSFLASVVCVVLLFC